MKALPESSMNSAKHRIIAYLVDQSVELSSEDERILARLETADELIQKKVAYPEIIKQISEKHQVSKFTAQNDVFMAQEVFGAARQVDKRYLLFHKYQRQEQDIEAVRKQMFKTDDYGNITLDAKLINALAKLEEAATYTMNSIPKEAVTPPVKAPLMVFNTVVNNGAQNAVTEPTMNIEEAIKKADAMLNLNNDADQPE